MIRNSHMQRDPKSSSCPETEKDPTSVTKPYRYLSEQDTKSTHRQFSLIGSLDS
jgi:hypothetical protein